MKKQACQRCYQYHEAHWGEDEDTEWADGYVSCPLAAVPVHYHGELVPEGNPVQKMCASIFGCANEVSGSPPKWCKFHKEDVKMDDELKEKLDEWLEENGYEDAVATAPRDGGDWAIPITTLMELATEFVESLEGDEIIENLGGEEAAIKMVERYGDEAGPYWKPEG